MAMNAQHLISRLQPLQQQGMNPRQAVHAALAQATPGAVTPHDVIVLNGAAVAQAVIVVFPGLPAAELAIILHEIYPALSALEIGRIILSAPVLPGTPAAVMLRALTGAGFDASTAADAVNVLYPITFTVESTQPWQATGLDVTGRQTTQITAEGRWTANPATGMAGPDGNRSYVAKPGYALPGAPEGALVGRVGNNAPFLVGSGVHAPAGQSGSLLLCINDDLDGRYGQGLRDNVGRLQVRVVTTPR